MRTIGNRDLKKAFAHLNKRFFNNELPEDCIVRFKDIEDDGEQLPNEINIHSDFRRHPDVATLTLLHEMAHLSLPFYKGQEQDGGHGSQFQAKIWELVKAGAFDGLL